MGGRHAGRIAVITGGASVGQAMAAKVTSEQHA
jgi:hypothetical protein